MQIRVGNDLKVEIVVIKNCNFIAKLIELQKNSCTLSCINPTRIPSLFVLESRLHHVLLSRSESRESLGDESSSAAEVNGWKTQNIHTELIYKLNPKRNIGQAYRNFGASSDGSVMCISCDGVTSIEEYFKANFNQDEMKDVEFISNEKDIEEYLKSNVDTQTINKLFNFSKEEIAKYSIEMNMVSYLAARDFNV